MLRSAIQLSGYAYSHYQLAGAPFLTAWVLDLEIWTLLLQGNDPELLVSTMCLSTWTLGRPPHP